MSIERKKPPTRRLLVWFAWTLGASVGVSFAILALPTASATAIATVTDALLAGLAVLAIALFIGAAGLFAGGAERRRARRTQGWTRSKRSSTDAVTPPPVPPTWVLNNLARHPRARGVDAFALARATVLQRVPAGAVVETLAGSPDLARIYTRAGFQRWHPTSLAMWTQIP